MRLLITAFTFAALLGFGQTPLPDTRPFGKYLVRVCTWPPGGTRVTCNDPSRMPAAASPDGVPQSIDFKLVADGEPVPAVDPVYPLVVGTDFFVSAKATSGLPVTVSRVAGNVTPEQRLSPPYQFHVNGPGTVVLRAEQAGAAGYRPASPVTLAFDIGPASPSSCKGLFPDPPAPRTIQTIDGPGIVKLLGAPVPYVLEVQGPNTILIYSTRYVFHPASEVRKVEEKTVKNVPTERETKITTERLSQDATEIEILDRLQYQMNVLLGRTTESLGLTAAKPFSVELSIPHAKALGDLAARLNSLNYSQFSVANVGSDRVRISAQSQPDCTLWTSFLTNIRNTASQLNPEPSSMRLYYLGQDNGANGAAQTGAVDVSKAFADLSPAAASPPAAAPASGGAATPTSGAPGAATISVSQPAGSVIDVKSDTTPCVIAGLTMGNSAGCAPGGGGSSGSSTSASSGGGAAVKPPAIGMAALETDLLLMSSSNPGDDAQIAERKRIIALLDLPRPEMIINGWVLQNSTTNPRAMGAFSSAMKELVSHYNERFEFVVLAAWDHIRRRIAGGNYFDEPFYHYIADRYVGDTHPAAAAKNNQDAAQQFLTSRPARLVFPDSTTPQDYGVCDAGRYCLGYSTLFQPVKPRLTDALLALVAAKDTLAETLRTIDFIEGRQPGDPPANAAAASIGPGYCENRPAEHREHCRTLWKDLDMARPGEIELTCENADLREILASTFTTPPDGHPKSRVYLHCFRQVAQHYLQGRDATGAVISPSAAGLMRAAVANFLFHYKMSQQYPHEFLPYELSQSADSLNAALTPLIDAFNRDLATFQRFVRGEVQRRVELINRDYDERCCAKRLFSLDKPSFFNDGIVTVRTISGQWTYASSTSQSFLDASSAPRLTDLLNSLTGTAGAAPAQAATAPISSLLPTKAGLASAQLGAAFLNNYQTTFAQIGRSLAISALPRSLATASSAEIVLSLNVDDQAGTGNYVGGPRNGTPANISRVSNNNTSTRVRVQSVKLFEISSASAVLERSRGRFPLIPPFVELPYIGTIAGIPLRAVKEFHQSTAILSAVVVPTAADIAYGLAFQFDLAAAGDKDTCSIVRSAGPVERCEVHRILSPKDFGANRSIDAFNSTMVHCLATDLRSGYASIGGFTPAAANVCANISFDNVPR